MIGMMSLLQVDYICFIQLRLKQSHTRNFQAKPIFQIQLLYTAANETTNHCAPTATFNYLLGSILTRKNTFSLDLNKQKP